MPAHFYAISQGIRVYTNKEHDVVKLYRKVKKSKVHKFDLKKKSHFSWSVVRFFFSYTWSQFSALSNFLIIPGPKVIKLFLFSTQNSTQKHKTYLAYFDIINV